MMKRNSSAKSRKVSKKDFSDKAVMFTLILVILLSVISIVTYIAVLHSVQINSGKAVTADKSQAQGVVSLGIVKPPLSAQNIPEMDKPQTIGEKNR